MSFLVQLFESLSDDELELVRSQTLSKREKNLLDELASGSNSSSADSKLTDGYLRKLRSGLYAKTLGAINKTNLEYINFFTKKHLPKHLMHWVRKIEKQLINTDEQDELRTIYKLTSRKLSGGAIHMYDLSFMQDMAERYASLFPEDKAGELLIRVNTLSMKSSMFREFPGKLSITELIEEAEEVSKEANGIDDPTLNFWLLNLKSELLKFTAPDESSVSSQIESIKEEIHELIERSGDAIPVEDQVYIQYKRVLRDYSNSQFNKAHNDLQEIFQDFPDVVWPRPNCATIMTQLAIIIGNYEQAKSTMLKGLSNAPGNEAFAIFGQFYLSLIDLLQGNLNESHERFNKIQAVHKTHFFWLNAYVKILENVYFAMIERDGLADRLALRHIKFYTSKESTPLLINLKSFHSIIRFAIKNRGTEANLPDHLVEAYHNWQNGNLAFMGLLLPIMLKKTAVKLPIVEQSR